MITDKSIPQVIVDLLNETYKIDPIAIDALLELGSPVNDELADHPYVQVRAKKSGAYPVLRLLGFLNGIATQYGDTIVAMYDDESEELLGFDLLKK